MTCAHCNLRNTKLRPACLSAFLHSLVVTSSPQPTESKDPDTLSVSRAIYKFPWFTWRYVADWGTEAGSGGSPGVCVCVCVCVCVYLCVCVLCVYVYVCMCRLSENGLQQVQGCHSCPTDQTKKCRPICMLGKLSEWKWLTCPCLQPQERSRATLAVFTLVMPSCSFEVNFNFFAVTAAVLKSVKLVQTIFDIDWKSCSHELKSKKVLSTNVKLQLMSTAKLQLLQQSHDCKFAVILMWKQTCSQCQKSCGQCHQCETPFPTSYMRSPRREMGTTAKCDMLWKYQGFFSTLSFTMPRMREKHVPQNSLPAPWWAADAKSKRSRLHIGCGLHVHGSEGNGRGICWCR